MTHTQRNELMKLRNDLAQIAEQEGIEERWRGVMKLFRDKLDKILEGVEEGK